MTTDPRRATQGGIVPATSDLDAFLAEIGKPAIDASTGHGRLIFALDATASRQPTWDTACTLQANMFREVATIGGLNMQLVYYRGLNECRASRWMSNSGQLAKTCRKSCARPGKPK